MSRFGETWYSWRPFSSALQFWSLTVQKSALLTALQQEICRHDFSHFVDEAAAIRPDLCELTKARVRAAHAARSHRMEAGRRRERRFGLCSR